MNVSGIPSSQGQAYYCNEPAYPLHDVIQKGDMDVLESLLKNSRCNLETQRLGETPLSMAMFSGNFKAALLLLQYGASVDWASQGWWVPDNSNFLHVIIQHICEKRHRSSHETDLLIERLLERDLTLIKAKNAAGETPFDIVIRYNNLKLVSLFRRCLSPWNQVCFVTTNEFRGKEIEKFYSAPVIGDRFIGTSCLETLNLASSRANVRYIDVIDISSTVKFFWENLLPILKETSDRHDAEERIGAFLQKNAQTLFGKLPNFMESITQHCRKLKEDPSSFLSSDERYSQIHNMAKEGCIQFFRCNLGDSSDTAQLLEDYNKEQIHPDCVYMSNIRDFLSKDEQPIFDSFVNKLRSLRGTSRAHFIDTEKAWQRFDMGRPSIPERVASLLEKAGIEQSPQPDGDDW